MGKIKNAASLFIIKKKNRKESSVSIIEFCFICDEKIGAEKGENFRKFYLGERGKNYRSFPGFIGISGGRG